jgi:hypothetical protein
MAAASFSTMNKPQMIERADGTKEWYLHSELHREDGAAYEGADGTKEWYLRSELHREDGAAYEGADGTKMWWLHDSYYENAEAWAKALLKSRNKMHDAQNVDAFLKQILKKYAEQTL